MTNKIWMTSDLHYGHRNICRFTNRHKDTTQEEHDEWLIALWNSTVHASDTVYHLGDLSFHKNVDKTIEILNRLNGNKVLLKGNHDHSDAFKRYTEAKAVRTEIYLEKTFNFNGENKHVCMFHFPISSHHKQSYGSYHLHGHCFDDETEVLTSEGFKFRDDVNASDRIATYNTETGFIEYQNYSEKHEYDVDSLMYELDGKSVNFKVTDEHRIYSVPYHKGVEGEVEVKPVKYLKGNQCFIVNGENSKPDYVISDKYLELYIQIVTDGSLENKSLVRFHLRKERKIQRLKEILTEIGISYSCNVQKSGTTKINFQLPCALQNFSLKPLDKNLIRNLSGRQVSIVLNEYRITDGCSTGKNSIQISTSKKIEADLLQEVLVTSGYCCNQIARPSGNFVLSVNFRKKSAINVSKSMCRARYTGKVWCLTVPNSTLVVRRGGKVHVTGNSHGGYTQGKGKILDVGIDNAFNLFGKHCFFDLEMIEEYMKTREVFIADQHRENL